MYTHVKTPPKMEEAGVDCQLINLNTMQVEHRDRTRKEDSLTTYRIMTPERMVLNMLFINRGCMIIIVSITNLK